MPKYLLDACALIAFLGDEEGNLVVKDLLLRAEREEITVSIQAANLIEVYYDRIRAIGSDAADTIIQGIYDVFPITVINALNPAVVREAAYLKTPGKRQDVLCRRDTRGYSPLHRSDRSNLRPCRI